MGDLLLFNHSKIREWYVEAMTKIHPESAILEIGCFRGESARIWLEERDKHNRHHHALLVDPYIKEGLPVDPPQETCDKMLDRVKEFSNYSFFRMTSDEWFQKVAPWLTVPTCNSGFPMKLKDCKIGFALLDGGHLPIEEINDLKNARKYMSDIAFYVLDDAHTDPNLPGGFEQVLDAIYSLYNDCYIRVQNVGVMNGVTLKQAYIWRGFKPQDA